MSFFENEPMSEYVFRNQKYSERNFLEAGNSKRVADQLWQNPELKNPSAFNEVPNERSMAPRLYCMKRWMYKVAFSPRFPSGILGLCATKWTCLVY